MITFLCLVVFEMSENIQLLSNETTNSKFTYRNILKTMKEYATI